MIDFFLVKSCYNFVTMVDPAAAPDAAPPMMAPAPVMMAPAAAAAAVPPAVAAVPVPLTDGEIQFREELARRKR